MHRTILHLDLDTFFVSVERKLDSRLKHKPILVGGLSDRGVVAACSYETRGYGVHSGMPMRMARELCPEAVVIRGNAGTYSKHSDEVTDIIREQVPLFEKSSIDEFYADLSGMDRFFGCYRYATELRQRIIRETGLPISFGLSVNKVVSKMATGEAKPNNQLKIDFGYEKPLLAPLSIKKIPMVGDKTYQTLRNLGLRQIRTLQEMPLEMKRLIRQEMLDPELLTGMLLSAHLIIFWLSQDSNVTPPVCLASFAAAGIAGTRPMATGLTSWKVAKGLYLVPLLFAYSPLISGTWPERLEVFGWSCLGLYALAGVLHWHLETRLNLSTAAVLLLSAALLMWMPFGIFFHLIGAGLLIAVIVWQRRVRETAADAVG